MEIEILSEKENPLLERKEINFRVSYEKTTPNINEVRSKLIEVLKSDKNLTVVDTINQEFGRRSAQGYVKVYSNKKAAEVEPKHKMKKNSLITDEKEQAAAKEGSKETAEVKESG